MHITTQLPPASEPVALSAVKAFLRIDYEGEDASVSALIASARARVEAETGLCLVERTLKLGWSCWPLNVRNTHKLILPIGPVSSIESVVVDEADHTQRFVLQKGKSDILKFRGAILPHVETRVEITLKAGFGPDESYVPADLKLAVKLLVAESYARGENGADLSQDVAVLLAAWRRVSL